MLPQTTLQEVEIKTLMKPFCKKKVGIKGICYLLKGKTRSTLKHVGKNTNAGKPRLTKQNTKGCYDFFGRQLLGCKFLHRMHILCDVFIFYVKLLLKHSQHGKVQPRVKLTFVSSF